MHEYDEVPDTELLSPHLTAEESVVEEKQSGVLGVLSPSVFRLPSHHT